MRGDEEWQELEAERDQLAMRLEQATRELARLKAEWQAEALEDFADDMTLDANMHTARARAEKLRRQAEEAS